ncbi:flagellar motor switch protein FliN [Massilia sp. NR 4-1]|uniref:flagellar motor switch protein FliN n=1 Tax=Massilia sp. NR 4-1 TaxID=1678028 RepID=UPI00067DBDDE|nr:flagellar motor switch protein FliN [Massilia sp. NR 4-1]
MTSNHKTAKAQTQLVELAELGGQTPSGPAILGDNLRLLDSVPVSLEVKVGNVQTTVGELMGLKEQAVLKIDRHSEQPVDVIVNGNVVARGQLVVVDDNFGVRITEIAAAA